MKRPSRRPKPGRAAAEEEAGFARRTPPPERTGLEGAYLSERRRSGSEVSVTLRDGRTLLGTLEEFDREMITLQVSGATPLVLRKSEIRYVTAEDDG